MWCKVVWDPDGFMKYLHGKNFIIKITKQNFVAGVRIDIMQQLVILSILVSMLQIYKVFFSIVNYLLNAKNKLQCETEQRDTETNVFRFPLRLYKPLTRHLLLSSLHDRDLFKPNAQGRHTIVIFSGVCYITHT